MVGKVSVITLLIGSAAAAHSMFYGGDIHPFPIHRVEVGNNTRGNDAKVFDNFLVDGSGWEIEFVFANFLVDGQPANKLHYEIRRDVSANNPGVLVAGGTFNAVATPTGNTALGLTEWNLFAEVPGFIVQPGMHWLTVTPASTGMGTHYLSRTAGMNSIGFPIYDGNSFYHSPRNGAIFRPFAQNVGSGNWDFSHGLGNWLDRLFNSDSRYHLHPPLLLSRYSQAARRLGR